MRTQALSASQILESGVEFVAVDNPHAKKLTVHILAAVAQHERELIAQTRAMAFRPPSRAARSSAIPRGRGK